jgi:nicotinate-nucleotide adenylyltransferase
LDEVVESLERFAIAPRAGVRADALARVIDALSPALRERIKTLKLPEVPESASLVRTLLSQGRSVRYLVPEPVWRYIVAHRLYGFKGNGSA